MGSKLFFSLFISNLFLFSNFAQANLGDSELVGSVSVNSGGSNSSNGQYASYETCKSIGNSPKICRTLTERGLNFIEKAELLSEKELNAELSGHTAGLNESQIEMYRGCRAHQNSAKICFRTARHENLKWGVSANSDERLQLSESVKDCVRKQAQQASGAMGLDVSDRLFSMQNLNSPNSFAARAIRMYYDLCTQGG